jgi:uncharacterized membrane protein
VKVLLQYYQQQPWLYYTLLTALCWGVWGSIMEYPEKFGFPATLGYITWAFTMIPCSYIAIKHGHKKIEFKLKAILIGSCTGILGAAGQLLLFSALKHGPAYTIFPIISLYPVLTIFLSILVLKEKTTNRCWLGIAVSIIAVLFLAYQQPSSSSTSGNLWLIFSFTIFIMWGIQEFLLKLGQCYMNSESIFFYMTITALMLTPIALWMTEFTTEINWGFKTKKGQTIY